MRFSTVAGEEGYADTDRDVRGFAVNFYDFIHSQERLPDSGLRSNHMEWDFWTLSPESAHQVTVLMSDRGTTATVTAPAPTMSSANNSSGPSG